MTYKDFKDECGCKTIKRVRLTLKCLEKLNELNEKYHISCFEIAGEDAYDFLIKMYELHLDKEDEEYVNYLLDLIQLYEKNGVYVSV